MSAMDSDSDSGEIPARYPIKGYALSGKIMLSAIVILFTVVVLMVCLHLYARWYLLRARRSRRRTHLVFYVEPGSTGTVPTRGIDASLLKSLPTFVYSSKTHPDVLECAVCLSEFEENEKGRLLPKCNHNFHINCIDMWFHSHSTCPLCRSPVDQEVSGPVPENRDEVVVSVGEPAETEAGSSSGLCPTCQHDEGDVGQGRSSSSVGSSSLGARRKPMELVGVTIEVPRRNESFGRSEEELGLSSPAGQVLRSLRRILSRDRRVGLSPSSGVAMGCGSVTESDIERGLEGDETQRTRAR